MRIAGYQIIPALALGGLCTGALLGIFLGGCSKPKSTPAPVATAVAVAPPVDDAAHKEAADLFTNRCGPCHGVGGGGDGPAAAAITPKPRNFVDKAWQATITDDYIEKIILNGGPSVGKSPIMPPNADLAEKQAVLAALREHIRSLAR